MAERRMFAKTIIDSDAFIDMPISARLLYYDLAMRADDDGFVNSPKKIMKFVGASVDDMNVLIARQFIIPYESGVVVIKHWKIHNYIQRDRYKPTRYQEEMGNLTVKNNAYYIEDLTEVSDLDTECIQDVYNLDTQDRLDKNKNRIESTRVRARAELPPENSENDSSENIKPENSKKPIRHKYGAYKNVLLTDDDMNKLKSEFPDDWQVRIESLSEYIASSGKTYKNHLATIRVWAKNDKDRKLNTQSESNEPQYKPLVLQMAKYRGERT